MSTQEKKIIYFDNSATTIRKAPGLDKALSCSLVGLGNAGRSFYDHSINAAKEVYACREELAQLFGIKNPLNIALTSSATESLNLVIYGLLGEKDHVLTTKSEHNSVLRPLYNSGSDISFIDLDDKGQIITDDLKQYLRKNTKAVICTHGSNLSGNITDVKTIRDFCRENGLIFVLDAAQTAGCIKIDNDLADFICFTGHKGLLGPQGTGGIVFCGNDITSEFPIEIIKTGGTGSNSFDKIQPHLMPDIFEAGTLNAHSISGLKKSCRFINETSIQKIREKESQLTEMFIDGLKNIEGIIHYGQNETKHRLPIVAINLKDLSSDDFAYKLWDEYKIATRSGTHCAPLIHEHFGTSDRGIVRFSFSYFNTEEEIRAALDAIEEISWNT